MLDTWASGVDEHLARVNYTLTFFFALSEFPSPTREGPRPTHSGPWGKSALCVRRAERVVTVIVMAGGACVAVYAHIHVQGRKEAVPWQLKEAVMSKSFGKISSLE